MTETKTCNKCGETKATSDGLVARGADMHARIVDGRTVLHLAADRDNGVKVIKLLLRQGVELNARDDEELTPLFYAPRVRS